MSEKISNQEYIDIVEEERSKGNIAFMTIEGLKGSSIENIINQPVEGILYDLNRDYATIITLAKNSKNLRWINDLALSDVFKEVFKLYKEQLEINARLTQELSEMKEKQNNKIINTEKEVTRDEKPKAKPINTMNNNRNGYGAYREGFDTSIVFQI